MKVGTGGAIHPGNGIDARDVIGDYAARGTRILITIHRFSLGGADRVAMMVARALAAAGMDVRLAVLRDGGEGENVLLPLLGPDVEVRRAGAALGSRHLELLRGLFFLGRETAAWRPHVVLASSNNMGLVTGLACGRLRADGPRLALKFTNPVVRPRDRGVLRTAYRRRLYRAVLGRFDLVLTLSDGERRTLTTLYPGLSDRLRTVANPYVTAEMLASERAAGPGRLVVGCGRLMPQ